MHTVLLKVTSAFVMAGEIVAPARKGKPPTLAEATKSEAKDLLRRGKAVLATDEDVKAAGLVVSSGTQDAPLHPVIEAHQQDREEQEAERQAEAEAASAASEEISSEGAAKAEETPAEAEKPRKSRKQK